MNRCDLLDVDSQSGVEQQIIADMRQTVPSTPLVVVTLHVQTPLIRGLLGANIHRHQPKLPVTPPQFVNHLHGQLPAGGGT